MTRPTHRLSGLGLLQVLGFALLQRYRQTGAAADLDLCIRTCRYVMQKMPADSPYRPGAATALGAALHRPLPSDRGLERAPGSC